ncbi:MAG: hypothetical protein LBT59_25355 [Clostridiales bacterium]|jgi:hypothetical protein|nr:hypothetical protein [Clostridiales bacterium]
MLSVSEKTYTDSDAIMKYCVSRFRGTKEIRAEVLGTRPDLNLEANFSFERPFGSYAIRDETAAKIIEQALSRSAIVKLGAEVTQMAALTAARSSCRELGFSFGVAEDEDGAFDVDGNVILDLAAELMSSELDTFALFGIGNEREPIGLSTLAGVKKHRYEELNKDTIELVKRQFIEGNPNPAKPGWVIGSGAWEKLFNTKGVIGKSKIRCDMEKGMLEGFPCFQANLFDGRDKGNELFLGDWAEFKVRYVPFMRLDFEQKMIEKLGDNWVLMINGRMIYEVLRDPKRFVGAKPHKA